MIATCETKEIADTTDDALLYSIRKKLNKLECNHVETVDILVLCGALSRSFNGDDSSLDVCICCHENSC